MPAMRRYTVGEFIARLKGLGFSDFPMELAEGTIGGMLLSPSGEPVQIPEPDEDGFIPDWHLSDILEQTGVGIRGIK